MTDYIHEITQYVNQNQTIVFIVIGLLTYALYKFIFQKKQEDFKLHLGDITKEALLKYNGDITYPVVTSLKGKIYDLSDAEKLYGPGGPYHVFAGRECSRALATMNPTEEECNAILEGLDEKQQKTLEDWIKKFDAKYPVIGQVVPMKYLTIEELRKYNGQTVETPIYVSIRGTIYDLSNNRSKYGANGPYNVFAGKESSRALAKFSLEEQDFNDNLVDLTKSEHSQLDDWERDFQMRYNIIGKIQKTQKPVSEQGKTIYEQASTTAKQSYDYVTEQGSSIVDQGSKMVGQSSQPQQNDNTRTTHATDSDQQSKHQVNNDKEISSPQIIT